MSLPIDAIIPDLLSTLSTHTTLVLQAPPGSGKTTRVPLALLPANFLGDKKIIMLEPRRLAARSAARYMARLLDQEPGHTVGYRTRLDSKVSQATRIEVVTEGILTRLLQDDATLSDYGVVIFDEFHERSLHADVGLALTRECQQILREDLRIVVMSATLDAAKMARLLGDAPVLRAEGRMFPVETRYRPLSRDVKLDNHVVTIIREALHTETGSLLVFLPGEAEIRRVAETLENTLPETVMLAPLYGQLTAEAQDRALSPCAEPLRKIVLATSIAETSLTIEGVRVVIDAGLLRLPQYDPNSAMTRLVTQKVSAANAEQRRGRAGRLEPGVCFRLWSEDEHARLSPFAPPEILQADLTSTVLELAKWGVSDPLAMNWLDAPPAATWAQARELLQKLSALDENGHITAHGKAMLALGLSPRLAHMVLRGRERGLGKLAAEIAALLSERDLLPHSHGADIHDRIALLRGDIHFSSVDKNRLRLVREGAQKLHREGQEKISCAEPITESADSAGLLLALAFPDHIGQRRAGNDARFLLSNGRGAFLPPEDRLARESWIVAADMDGKAREARVFLAAAVSLPALEDIASDVMKECEQIVWESSTQSVAARWQRTLGALVLEEKSLASPSPEKIKSVFCAALREAGLAVLPWTDELRQWQARVAIMHRLEPTSWPDVSDAALLISLEEWAGPFLDGMSRFTHLTKFPLADALHALLDWNAQQQLHQYLPTHLTVPTGSDIRIDYSQEHDPVLAVKLQEMFGVMETPRLANGRVPLTIHLLSPAQRPVAVTQDLASFWKNAYADVRRDLRGRYPKHPWPEDPFTAEAQRGVKHPKPRA